MSQSNKQKTVLRILSENAEKEQPQYVNSNFIASKLSISLKETNDIIKIMQQKGIVECDLDGQLSIITHKGYEWYKVMTCY